MTVFEDIKSKNIDELVEWLDKHGASEDNPWIKWFDRTYCRKCEPVVASFVSDCYGSYYSAEHEFAWCELYRNCRYFNDMKNVPNRKQTIKLWLESEVK